MSYIRRIKWYFNHYGDDVICGKCNRPIFYSTDDDAETFYIMCKECFQKKTEKPKIKAKDGYHQTSFIGGA